jgi:YidC/Oxa1 family membrane protein insertase
MDFDLKDILKAMLICLLIMIGWQYLQQKRQPPAEPSDQQQQGAAPQTKQAPLPAPQGAVTDPPQEQPEQPVITGGGGDWQVRQEAPGEDIILGDRYEISGYKAQITIDSSSAAVEEVLLSEYKHKVNDEKTGYPLLSLCLDENNRRMRSFALGRLKLIGRTETFELSAGCWRLSQD